MTNVAETDLNLFDSDKDAITKAFRDLRKLGYFARQNFWCCQNCAWSAVPDEKSDKAIFYHNQDNDAFNGKDLKEELALAWSGDATEIVESLNKTLQGWLYVYHNGSENKRIMLVPLDKKEEFLINEKMEEIREKYSESEGLVEGDNKVTNKEELLGLLLNTKLPKERSIFTKINIVLSFDSKVATEPKNIRNLFEDLKRSDKVEINGKEYLYDSVQSVTISYED